MASAQIVQQGKALYAYTGTEWIPLNGGNSLVNATRWQKTLSASASSFSGDDDFGDSLIYTPEYEQLYLNGILLARNIDYTATDGLVVTLNSPANSGDIVEILALNNISVANTYTKNQIDTKIADTFNRWTKTLSASATLLSGEDDDSNVLSYTPGLEKVYVNGILLAPEEYTATSGSSVILDEAGVESDIIQIQTFKNFRIANHYTISQTDDQFLSKTDASGTYATVANTYTQSQVDGFLDLKTNVSANGLVHINTVSIGSSVSTINVDNVFSSDYINYKLIFNLSNTTSSTDASLLLRMRASGSDNSGNDYLRRGYAITTSLIPLSDQSTSFSFITLTGIAPGRSNTTIELRAPFLAKPTFLFSDTSAIGAGTLEASHIATQHNVATSYDGFSILVSSGNISNGTIAIYGYKQ